MTALKILGCTAGGLVAGLIGGVAWSSRKGQDLDLASGLDLFFDAGVGCFVGAAAGLVAGLALFT